MWKTQFEEYKDKAKLLEKQVEEEKKKKMAILRRNRL
jgi:hypothetical protein